MSKTIGSSSPGSSASPFKGWREGVGVGEGSGVGVGDGAGTGVTGGSDSGAASTSTAIIVGISTRCTSASSAIGMRMHAAAHSAPSDSPKTVAVQRPFFGVRGFVRRCMGAFLSIFFEMLPLYDRNAGKVCRFFEQTAI